MESREFDKFLSALVCCNLLRRRASARAQARKFEEARRARLLLSEEPRRILEGKKFYEACGAPVRGGKILKFAEVLMLHRERVVGKSWAVRHI